MDGSPLVSKFILSGPKGLPLRADHKKPKDCFHVVSAIRSVSAFGVFTVTLLLAFRLLSPSAFQWSPSTSTSTSVLIDHPDSSTEHGPNSGGTKVANPEWLPLDFQLDPFFYSYSDKLTGTVSSSHKLESISIEDPIGNADTNVIVNSVTRHGISNVDDQAAKRQRMASPTTSPTSECNPDNYIAQRDTSAIDIQSSPKVAYALNPRYTRLIRIAGNEMMRILADALPALVYNPESADVPIDVMRSVCGALSDCNHAYHWKNLKSTNQTVIYGHVHDASNQVRYVGYTSNYTRRQNYHLENRGAEYFSTRTSVRLVSYDNIPPMEDRLLSNRLIQFWRDVLQLDDLPPTLQYMYRKIMESWHRGGIKKQQSALLIEQGVQRRYRLPGVVAEPFMYDENKEATLKRYATETGDALAALVDRAWGRNVSIDPRQLFAISTWKTGAPESRLSSAIVATVYMLLGSNNWRNTFPFAIYPNARTEEEIFTPPTSPEHLALGEANFWDYLRPFAENSERHSVVLVDSQDYLFDSLVDPQMVLCELGFKLEESFLGGEVIVFRKDMALAFLHGHPANVCDSRREFPVTSSQRRAVAVDAMRRMVQRAVGDDTPRRFGAILGSIFTEIFVYGHHGNRKFVAALCRDNMYPGDAVDRFHGAMTPNDINHPTSDFARHHSRRQLADDETIWPMGRFTNTISQIGVENAVQEMHSSMLGKLESNQRAKWRETISWYRGHAELQRRVRDAARQLPSGGDQAPRRLAQQASRDVNTVLRTAIVDYNQGSRPLSEFRAFFVKNADMNYSEERFAGVPVFNLWTSTSPGGSGTRSLSNILSRIAKSNDVSPLIKAFKKLVTQECVEFLAQHDGIEEIPEQLVLYKLIPR